MNCAECGQHLPEGARFCTACGRRVEPVLECPQCRTQAPEGARYCFKCGTALTAPAPAEAAPPPKPEPAPRAAPPASVAPPPPERVEPRLDRGKVSGGTIDSEAPGSARGRKEPVVRIPGSASESKTRKSAPHDLRKAWPLGMVALGLALAAAIYWSDSRDEILAKAAAERRMASATEAFATSHSAAVDDTAFSAREVVPAIGAASPRVR